MPALLANWSCWPLAQLINFTVIPLDLRILYVNLLSIAWTAYISSIASGDASGSLAAPAEAEQPVAAVSGADVGRAKGGAGAGGPLARGGAGAAAASGPRLASASQRQAMRRGRRAGPTSV
jgi:hypothetical protein